MNSQDRYRQADDIVAREVGGETVLLDLDAGTYFGLNSVGGRVWQLLADEPLGQDELCHRLTEEFDAPTEEIAADLQGLLQDLLDNGLIQAAA
jgi:hypothetical protein